MKSAARKAATLAWKERKPVIGIFALRCTVSGETWVGGSPTLDRAQNRLWFSLKHGQTRPAALQAAWNVHGETAFAFESLEQIEEADIAFSQRATLQERRDAWAARLGATAI